MFIVQTIDFFFDNQLYFYWGLFFSATYCSFLLFGISPMFTQMLAVFLVTYSIYNLNKFADKDEDTINMPDRITYIQNKEKLLTTLSILAYIVAMVVGYLGDKKSLIILIVPLIAGVFYCLNVFRIPKLKNILLVKNIVVSLSITIVVTFISAIHVKELHIRLLLIVFYFFFIKLFVNTVLFDIRDIKGDKENNVRTIPIIFGIKKTKTALFLLQSSLILVFIFSLPLQLPIYFYLMMLVGIVYGYLYIAYFGRKKIFMKHSLDLLLDGEWIMLAIIGFVMQLFFVL